MKTMTIKRGKWGLAVIGYSRPDYLKQCLESLNKNDWGGADYRLLVLDYKDEETKNKNMLVAIEANVNNIIYFDSNRGVAKAKNEAFKRMLNEDCDHIFVMEDDILMTRPDTCLWYIQSALEYNVEHLNIAHHGPANVGKKALLEWKPDIFVRVHPNCVGAFSYYTRHCLEEVGLIDEKFLNAWEHVEHTKRIIDAGMHPPFWYFADAPISFEYLKEIPGSIIQSSIRPRSDWKNNIDTGKNYWVEKHGQWLPPFPSEYWS